MENTVFLYSKDHYSKFYERVPHSDEHSAQDNKKFNPLESKHTISSWTER